MTTTQNNNAHFFFFGSNLYHENKNSSEEEEEEAVVSEAKVAAVTATRDLGTKKGKRERDFFYPNRNTSSSLFRIPLFLSFHFNRTHQRHPLSRPCQKSLVPLSLYRNSWSFIYYNRTESAL